MRRGILLVLAVAACSDPAKNDGATSCQLGMIRDPGPSCSIPNVPMTIDGDPSDFAQPALDDAWHSLWHSCAPDQCNLIWAVDGDSLVFNGSRKQDPSDDLATGIQFAQYSDFSGAVVWVDFWKSGFTVGIKDYNYSNIPIDYAFTPAGWEVRIPRAIIPFNGFAYVQRYELTHRNNSWVSTWAGIDFAMCWESSDPRDPCNGTDVYDQRDPNNH